MSSLLMTSDGARLIQKPVHADPLQPRPVLGDLAPAECTDEGPEVPTQVCKSPLTLLPLRLQQRAVDGSSETESQPVVSILLQDMKQEEKAEGSTVAHQFSVEDSLVIFDWDDTLFPSSWVQDDRIPLNRPPEHMKASLKEIADIVAFTLDLAQKLGQVLIVTNAEKGWIEHSCKNMLPDLLPTLQKVSQISARSIYEQRSGFDPVQWKLDAFVVEIQRFFPAETIHRRKNVLSIGDSAHEREAVLAATANIENCRCKSVKLIERPSVEQLLKEQRTLVRCLASLVRHDGNLDICLAPYND